MIEHILVAFFIQAAFAHMSRSWTVGAVAGSMWGISREIAQAEYRWIERFGEGLRVNMPWWGGLDPSVWGYIDPWLDWVAPMAVVFGIAYSVRWFESANAKAGVGDGARP